MVWGVAWCRFNTSCVAWCDVCVYLSGAAWCEVLLSANSTPPVLRGVVFVCVFQVLHGVRCCLVQIRHLLCCVVWHDVSFPSRGIWCDVFVYGMMCVYGMMFVYIV
jgi:hypothetical protein